MNEIANLNNKNFTISNTKSKQLMNITFKRPLPAYLTKEEVYQILDKAQHNKRDWLFIYFLWCTGLRVSEACGKRGIRKGNIDFYNKLMKVTWLKKRKEMQRVVPMHPDLAYNLSLYTGNLNNADLLFSFSRQYATTDLIKKYIPKDLDKKVTSHIFRHSFAVYFLKQTKNLFMLKELLGHENITTTMIYLRIVNYDIAEVLNTVMF